MDNEEEDNAARGWHQKTKKNKLFVKYHEKLHAHYQKKLKK